MTVTSFPPVFDALGADANTTIASPARKMSVYWHGTLVSHLDSILEHGLRPENTKSYDHVCLASKAHVAHFYSRINQMMDDAGPAVLIKIPGHLIDTRHFCIETGTISGAYGSNLEQRTPEALKKIKRWEDFQAATDVVGYTQTIPVTQDMLDFRCQAFETHPNCVDMPALLEEYGTGHPTIINPALKKAA